MNEFEAFIFCLSIRMMIVNKRNGYIELKIQAIVFFEWFLNNRMVVDEFAKNVYYKRVSSYMSFDSMKDTIVATSWCFLGRL